MAIIRVAVIGIGQWGPNLIRNFHNKQTSEVVWIIDREADRLEEVHAHVPDVQVAKDPEQALDDSSVQAVVFATPTSTHYAIAKEALGRRKHVLVEKPLTVKVQQAPTSSVRRERPADPYGRSRVHLQSRSTEGEKISRRRAFRTRVLRVDGSYESWTHSLGCECRVGPCGARRFRKPKPIKPFAINLAS